MSERWFFALWPDPDTAAAIADVAAACAPPGVRRVHPLDLHLTLRFLGALSDEALTLAQRTVDALRWGPVSLRIDRLGCFRRSQVMWCAPARPDPGLLGLAASLEAALTKAGFAPEGRPFVPHVTLARRVARCPRGRWPQPQDWTSGELVLAFGRQGPAPRYVKHRRWKLVGAAPP